MTSTSDQLPLLRQAWQAAGSLDAESQSAVRLRLAEALLEAGQPDEAETLFRQEQAAQPDSARAAVGLGQIALARGHDEDAARLLAAVQDSPFARKKVAAQLASVARAAGRTLAGPLPPRRAGRAPGRRGLAWR